MAVDDPIAETPLAEPLGAARIARGPRRRLRPRQPLALLGIVPFLLFTGVFLVVPTFELVRGSLESSETGSFTLSNISALFEAQFRGAYWSSIKLSAVSALIGGVLGLLMAYAAVARGAPRLIRPILSTFSGVAANFAGVPLAFAFVATLGNVGIVTAFLKDHAGIDLYGHGFTLFDFWGLALTYVYFQIPLMILVIAPAIDGIKVQWREAAENLGATPAQFWRYVGLPVLAPSLLGALLLLFANAFSAYATAYALTAGAAVTLVPLLIGSAVSGDVFSNPNQADALAVGMIAIVTLTVVAYSLLERRAGRWTRR
jgi:putative spermidine/putrescine transport system permease protein